MPLKRKESDMKKTRKFLALLMAAVMVMAMGLTAFAEDPDPGQGTTPPPTNTKTVNEFPLGNNQPSSADKVKVSVDGITTEQKDADAGKAEKVTVTLYKIAKANYGQNGATGFMEYEWIKEGLFADVKAPTANEITAIANQLKAGGIEVEGVKVLSINATGETYPLTKTDVTGTFEQEVSAGVYIAIISGSACGYVYNPVLLTATYEATTDADGNVTGVVLEGGKIDLSNADYIYGSTAVAKRTVPKIDKTIDNEANDKSDENLNENDLHTGSVGDVIRYTVTPTMPEYPTAASNKTFFIGDTMSEGLTFQYNSLNVTLKDAAGAAGPAVTRTQETVDFKNAAGEDVSAVKYTYSITVEVNGINVTKEIATAYGTVVVGGKATTATTTVSPTGFSLNFDYDSLVYGDAGAVYAPIVKYSAVVNEKAVVGDPGNENEARLYYTSEPNNGNTWTPDSDNPGGEPEEGNGIERFEDEEIVYTYQLSFIKTGVDGKALADAVFGIYKNGDTTTNTVSGLVDQVTTNENGFAISTNVGAGTYYIKEITAPKGYTLNEQVYEITADWKSVTTKVTATVTDRTYTTEADKALTGEQVGWLKDGVFYAMDQEHPADAQAAYLSSENTTTTNAVTKEMNPNVPDGDVNVQEGQGAGSGTVTLATKIPNTKLSALPSTGGIGTTIFTIGGCVIMIAAAGLFFATRRKAEKQ